MPLKAKGGLLIITQEGSCKTGRPCANQNMWLITLHRGGNRSSWKGSNLSKATQLSQVEKLPQPRIRRIIPLHGSYRAKPRSLCLYQCSPVGISQQRLAGAKPKMPVQGRTGNRKEHFGLYQYQGWSFYCCNPSLFD